VSGVVLRGYRAGDVEAMYALDVACFEKPFRFSRSAMRRFAEATKARVVVAEEGGGVVGFGIVHVEEGELGRAGYVVTLDVAVEHRRKGLAAGMMAELERQALGDGCGAMVLHVFTGNEAATRFYERGGFVRSHRARGFYGKGLDAWVYQKRLA
jgi:[ribosomal protein S18]-alanine N-acetyltransferase